MRSLEECRAEVFRRSEDRIRRRRQRRNRILAVCVPLVLCVTVLAAEMLQASGKREPPVNEASGDAVRRIEVSGGSEQRSITDGHTLGELTEMLEGLTMGDADGSDYASLPPVTGDVYTITTVTYAGKAAVYRLAGDRLTDETAGKTVCLSDKQAQELLALLEPAQ